MRSVVVLPQPDGPSSTSVSPAPICRSSGSSTRVPRNVFAHCVSVMGTESSFMVCRWSGLKAIVRRSDAVVCRFGAALAGGIDAEPLHRDQQRHRHDEKQNRVRAADLDAHRRVGIGETDRQGLRVGRVQHPGQIEFADGERQHRQRARDDARPHIGQHDRHEALQEARAEARRAFFERAQIGARAARRRPRAP